MVSGVVTAILLVLFIAGWIWAWSPKRKQAFAAAARLPLDDQEPVADKDGDRNQEQSS
ncbi:CcoQ/FixQ family Cbb3-type cytochrome c oxidase assembly chaperone [Lysobacteraceae bacterium NML75-0749]|nr:CcoQ/FixQ family Cbb3-type cytochrome c oxidase assembly chaperone [Xanthomonadaceae bacterium NML03-0222]PJJ98957.1 CcoQ/FixQ family Cbb3-type cytochrome c oxidase assembly chaperone [Xanthomonadaceae bacterium NML75-0749]PJK03687.1 CcoQ/FixQ family Cbb3-type cytochrome c oxidase assembly chaperone [Xanthomonadaceae bacterium NML91-0268]PJK07160.1 CcoQ/FixQ family Cbb3-type cytochrome c oxidase assembly chaperone [Xanthomonadaceae bacterium NML71-0210]